MKKSKAAKAISQLALLHGVSENEIREEIQIALDMGMSNPDAKVQAYWKDILQAIKPTPETMIEYLSKQTKKDM